MVRYLARHCEEAQPVPTIRERSNPLSGVKQQDINGADCFVPRNDGNGLSPEAQTVLAEGKKLWHAYFAHTDMRSVRDELKLNRPDVGWYQIRKALQARNSSGDFVPVSFKPFETAYKALTEKLQPMVYELGFLRV